MTAFYLFLYIIVAVALIAEVNDGLRFALRKRINALGISVSISISYDSPECFARFFQTKSYSCAHRILNSGGDQPCHFVHESHGVRNLVGLPTRRLLDSFHGSLAFSHSAHNRYWLYLRPLWNGTDQTSLLYSERIGRMSAQLLNCVMGLLVRVEICLVPSITFSFDPVSCFPIHRFFLFHGIRSGAQAWVLGGRPW